MTSSGSSARPGYFAVAWFAAGFPLQVIWMPGIYGPHVLATVTRTYFDRQARKELGPALWAIVRWPDSPLVELPRQISLAGYLALTLGWIGRQALKAYRGLPLNLPKLALIAAVVPLQWLAFSHASQFGPDGIIRAGIMLGLFHTTASSSSTITTGTAHPKPWNATASPPAWRKTSGSISASRSF